MLPVLEAQTSCRLKKPRLGYGPKRRLPYHGPPNALSLAQPSLSIRTHRRSLTIAAPLSPLSSSPPPLSKRIPPELGTSLLASSVRWRCFSRDKKTDRAISVRLLPNFLFFFFLSPFLFLTTRFPYIVFFSSNPTRYAPWDPPAQTHVSCS